MAENKATALNQAYKIKLILEGEDRPHPIDEIDEHSSVVIDLTEVLKEKKIGATTDLGGYSPARRIVGVQEIYGKNPEGVIIPLFHRLALTGLQERIRDIIRVSIVNEKQYEAVMRMVYQAFFDETDKRERLCHDIIKTE